MSDIPIRRAISLPEWIAKIPIISKCAFVSRYYTMSNLFSGPLGSLLYALQTNNLDKVTAILKESTDPCKLIRGKHGNTLGLTMLTYAAYIDVKPEILHKMIDVCPDALVDRDPGGLTPLHRALSRMYSYDTILHMLLKDPTYPKVLEKSEMAQTPLDVLRYTPKEYRERISPLVDISKTGSEIVREARERAFERRKHALRAYAMHEAAIVNRTTKGSGTRRRSRMSFTRKRRSLNKKK
jgi:hypothetical protein